MTMLDITLADRKILGVTREEAEKLGVAEAEIAKAETETSAAKAKAAIPQNLFMHLAEFATGIAAAKDLAAVKQAAQKFCDVTGGIPPVAKVI